MKVEVHSPRFGSCCATFMFYVSVLYLGVGMSTVQTWHKKNEEKTPPRSLSVSCLFS